MKTSVKIFIGLMMILAVIIFILTIQPSDRKPVDYVDPFIGTDFYAHTFPGPGRPFGMVHLSPDTDTTGWTYSGGYHYRDPSIMGFSHTHYSGTGWASKGDILLMPTVSRELMIEPGEKNSPQSGYRSRYDHRQEEAKAGYYAVYLQDYGIKAELTATARVGIHRYTFPASKDAHIIIDLGHQIGLKPQGDSYICFVSDTEIEGYKQGAGAIVYFVARFSKPFWTYGVWDRSYEKPETDMRLNPYKTAEKGNDIGAFVNYRTSDQEKVIIKVALSYVSIEGARKNMDQEAPHWDFDRICGEARHTWNEALSAIQVNGGDEDRKNIFYTSVYHSLMAVNISSDVDGSYTGMDGNSYHAETFNFYPSFFAWDTYRSQHPLLTLIAAGQVDDMLKSIVAKVRHYGWLPAQHVRNRYGQGMVGDHLVPIIVDAYMKGFRDFDVELLYESMRSKALFFPPPPHPREEARAGLEYYLKLGYTPADRVMESVANTLELAYDDWCIAQLALALGKKQDYERFMKHSANYKNLFDSQSKFMRPRLADGTWLPDCEGTAPQIARYGDHVYYDCFDPLWVGLMPNRHYAESNAWQYLWFVPHDIPGLIETFGDVQAFTAKLDTCLTMSPLIHGNNYVGVVGTIGQYVHGNQPSHHIMYLYDYAGQPWKTQKYVRRVMDELYRTGPGGLCGNEDMGSLSSWYVFSALGFYPVCPGANRYMIGSPLFEKAVLHLNTADSKEVIFQIIADGVSDQNIYIQSATLNGQSYDQPWIDHETLAKGGELRFDMGPQPNKNWGIIKVR